MPPEGLETPLTVGAAPSMSESLAVEVAGRRSPTSVSSVPEAVSSTAVGSSLTHVMSIVTCAVSVPPWPSSTV